MSNITRPATYSVSRLRTYHLCSTLFKYKYVDKLRDNSLSKATLIGSSLHQILEDTYNPFINIENPPRTLVYPTIISSMNEVLTKVFVHDLTKQIEIIHNHYLVIKELYYRASEEYRGPDPIRKGDGTIAQAPEMTGAWKKEISKLNIANNQDEINEYIRSVDGRWEGIDFFDLVLTVIKIAYKFELDSRINKILGVELAFSPETNQLVTPNTGEDGPLLEAYIDLVAELDNGEIAIIDYKSGAQDYQEVDIAYNDQLLMYSYAYEALTKEQPKYIGIYNLRSNKLILSEMVPIFREQAIAQLTSVHKDIIAEKYEKKLPNKQMTNSSPCLDQFHKPCPFLALCHPEIAAKIIQ